MLDKIRLTYHSAGVAGVLTAVRGRLMGKQARSLALCRGLLAGGTGLEIGGPSEIFSAQGILPIYPGLERLDNCNFSGETTWEGRIVEGMTFQYDPGRPPGRQYIAEAADLRAIPSESYDFVLSSHVIEHTANPLRALSEWLRVLRGGGVLVLVVPHKDGTFDHRRPVTALAHIRDDLRNGTAEDDLTHLQEILELHDLERDTLASRDEFKRRSEQNAVNRCLHHHVFDTSLVVRLLLHAQLTIDAVECMLPYHIIAVARKTPTASAVAESEAENILRGYLGRSLFVSDRRRLKTGLF